MSEYFFYSILKKKDIFLLQIDEKKVIIFGEESQQKKKQAQATNSNTPLPRSNNDPQLLAVFFAKEKTTDLQNLIRVHNLPSLPCALLVIEISD